LELPATTHDGFDLISDPIKIVSATKTFYDNYFSDDVDGEGTFTEYLLWQDSDEGLQARRDLATETADLSPEFLSRLAPAHLHAALLTVLPHVRLHPKLQSTPSILAEIQESMSQPISEEEWSSYWSGKSANKSTGYSSLTVDLIKHLPPPISDAMLQMTNQAISSLYIPTPWKERVLKSIPKTESDMRLDYTRPIQLQHPISKASLGILSNRYMSLLAKHSILNELQFAFLTGKSTQDSQFLHTVLVEDAHTNHTPLYVLHADLRRAFDSVHHLWGREVSLRRLGCPEQLIQYLLNCDRGNKTYIYSPYVDMYNPEYEGVFESKIGYAQGGEDSPSGYIIFKDMFLSFLSSCPDLDAPKINGKVIPDNTYADDLRIYSTKFKGFGNGLNALEVFLSMIMIIFITCRLNGGTT